MDRDSLLEALDHPGDAFEACRADLRQGAEVAIHPGTVPTRELSVAYRQRVELASERGTPSIGFPEAVESLEVCTHDELRLAHVEGGPSGFFFQLFLTVDQTAVVACLGILHEQERT